MELGKWISKSDALVMLEIINLCLCCKSKDDYKRLIAPYKTLIPFDYAFSGLTATIHNSYASLLSTFINNGYPEEFIKEYTDNKYFLIDTYFQQFFKTLDIQSCREHKHQGGPDEVVNKLREDFGLDNSFLYGMYNSNLNYYSVISVAGKQLKNDNRTRVIIKGLAPYMSMSLQHLLPIPIKQDTVPLTSMESEILTWLKEGKSAWEISVILNRSERTVVFHIGNIIRKLNANNRTHAVAIALAKKLIDL